MTATTEVRVLHGAAPGLGTNATALTLRFKQSDDDTQDALAPIPVPSAGKAYSYRKSFLFVATTAPDNVISNLRFFSDGTSLGTGRKVLFARSSSYVQASATDVTASVGSTDVTTLTATSPETIQAGNLILSTDSFPTAGAALQEYVMLQLEASTSATAGNSSSAMTLSYRYDET